VIELRLDNNRLELDSLDVDIVQLVTKLPHLMVSALCVPFFGLPMSLLISLLSTLRFLTFKEMI
jgi:hypothetical protein